MKISDLSPNKRNPRKIEAQKLDMLAKSMQEFGSLDGFIFNRTTKQLAGGHQRQKVMPPDSKVVIEENLEKPNQYGTVARGFVEWNGERFPYREVEWDENKEKAANIAANKGAGEWDLPKLQEFVLELDAANFDLSLTMFDDEEIKDLFGKDFGSDPAKEATEDEVPEPTKSISVLGDIYELGEHRLMCGDSTSIDAVEKLMAGSKADMVFTDPPYGMKLDADFSKIGNDESGHGNKYKNVHGDHDDFTPELINTIFTFDSAREMFIWGADYFAQLLPNRNDGSWVVWDKRVTDNFDKMIGSGFELCWSKNRHQRLLARFNYSKFGDTKDDSKSRVHPTQKPVQLVEFFFENWGEPADKVVDLYGGSGSTLIACEKTKRKCFMMELDPYYISVIIERWVKYSGKMAYLINEDGSKTSWSELNEKRR